VVASGSLFSQRSEQIQSVWKHQVKVAFISLIAYALLLPVGAVEVYGLATGTLDLYGLNGWRPFESVLLCAVYLAAVFTLYYLKQKPRPSYGGSKSSSKARRNASKNVRRLGLRQLDKRISAIFACSLLLLVLPVFDVVHMAGKSISAYLKFKSAREETKTALPSASKLNIDGQKIENQDFSGQDLALARAASATLKDVSFSGATLEEADFRGAKFVYRVELSNAKLCGADMRGADLTGATGIGQGTDLRFTIVDNKTKFPTSLDPMFLNGIIYDNSSSGRIYQCHEGVARILHSDGTRD
jgi:hypothetical protein